MGDGGLCQMMDGQNMMLKSCADNLDTKHKVFHTCIKEPLHNMHTAIPTPSCYDFFAQPSSSLCIFLYTHEDIVLQE